MSPSVHEVTREVERQAAFVSRLRQEVAKVVVGQRYMVDRILLALLADGHILIEGVPGLAKTTTVKAVAQCIQTAFSRIQFTPDLLPADLIGTRVYQPHEGAFTVKKGPVFTNLLLADEINRAPAKVQSALLEAMQEEQVTIGETTFPLPQPFLVLATQNPIEQEGTYPLPEAQVDRFMLKLDVGYPTKVEEVEIMRRMARRERPEVEPVTSPEEILLAREVADEVYVDDKLFDYVANLVFATRYPADHGLERLDKLIDVGASPRASIALIQAAKVQAFLEGRGYVTPQDIKTIAPDVLRHRILVSYEAEAQDLTSDALIQDVLGSIDVP